MAARQHALEALTASLRALAWIGARARWILAIGAVSALAFQDAAALLRPFLPWFVGLMFAVAMVRIDLLAVLRGALRPGRLSLTLSLVVAMTLATPAILYGLAKLAGLPPEALAALVYTQTAPPIASAAGLALIMGLEAALALEVTILASLLTPLTGPLMTALLLGDAIAIDAPALALRLALIVSGGALAAILFRRIVGGARIAAHGRVFDGIAALAMLSFILPVFDGVTAQLQAHPLRAASVLLLVATANFGLQIVAAAVGNRFAEAPASGSAAVMWGNRNVGLYLAALPESPFLTLYVALYQFPMYLTPLLMPPLFRCLRRARQFTRS